MDRSVRVGLVSAEPEWRPPQIQFPPVMDEFGEKLSVELWPCWLHACFMGWCCGLRLRLQCPLRLFHWYNQNRLTAKCHKGAGLLTACTSCCMCVCIWQRCAFLIFVYLTCTLLQNELQSLRNFYQVTQECNHGNHSSLCSVQTFPSFLFNRNLWVIINGDRGSRCFRSRN